MAVSNRSFCNGWEVVVDRISILVDETKHTSRVVVCVWCGHCLKDCNVDSKPNECMYRGRCIVATTTFSFCCSRKHGVMAHGGMGIGRRISLPNIQSLFSLILASVVSDASWNTFMNECPPTTDQASQADDGRCLTKKNR
jgi:hypothetical protein